MYVVNRAPLWKASVNVNVLQLSYQKFDIEGYLLEGIADFIVKLCLDKAT